MKKVLLPLCFWLTGLHAVAQVRAHPQNYKGELHFTENKGQWGKALRYKAKIPNGTLYLENNRFYFQLFSADDLALMQHPGVKGKVTIHGHAFREEFEGANTNPEIKGNKALSYHENYFLGNDSAHWAGNVNLFHEIEYAALYPGIDIRIYSRSDMQVNYDFIINPGADINEIKIHYNGIDNLELRNGELFIQTSVGGMLEQKPVAYQEINGARKEVKCNFVLQDKRIKFSAPNGYDKNYPLVIDPNIVFSTYTGADADNWGYTATYDEQGNMFLAGLVRATSDPYNLADTGSSYNATVGAFQTTWGGGNDTSGILWACDMGVSKFSSDGSTLLYRTFIGGNSNETPNSLVADANDNLIIYGVSYSSNFPVTAGAYNTTYRGNGDIVVVKLNSTGSALLGSTFVGGSNSDGINYDPSEYNPGNLKRNYGDQNRGEVEIDASGNIFVASCTMSSDFPVTAGALQTGFGGTQDGCVFKLNNNCTQLLWSTYLGGSFDDACYSLDLGPNGTLYVAGGTMSSNFPTTNGALNTNYIGGNFDGFVAWINSTGTQLLSSTYIGTAGDDQVYCVKLDLENNVYFMGQTNGAYPVQSAPYSNANSGQFIVKLNPMLDSVFYSTVFGSGTGKPNISPTAFLVDTCQNVYVAGWGTDNSIFTSYFSPIYANNMLNMPLTPDALQSTTDGTDFYFFVLEKNAISMLFGSYFGGNGYIDHVDGGTSRFDKRGIIYEAICAGCGGNSLTPTTAGAWSTTNDSWNCNELGLKIAFNLATTQVNVQAHPRATGCVPLTVQFQSTNYNVQFLEWYFGDGDSSNAVNPQHTFVDTGTYNVMLVGYNPNSCNERDTAYISVWVRNDSLSANFLSRLAINCDSIEATFVSHNYSTTQYLWNFGDGTTATTDSVTHRYVHAGNYHVVLIVTDTTKCSLVDTFTANIFIPVIIEPVVALSGSRGCIPYTVNFNAPFYPGADYYWDFGDGTSADSFSVTHTYTTADSFHITLYIYDSLACNPYDTARALVVTIDSFANAGFDFTRTFYACDSVHVVLWTSYQGEQLETWDFGDGTQATDVDTVQHTYTIPGTFTITHIIYDPRMVCKQRDTVQIAFSLLPLDISLTIPDTGGCLPFTADFTGGSALLSTNYFWWFGDGDSTHGNPLSHTYYNTGTYYVKLIAIDTNACIGYDSAQATIVVINDSVIAAFQANILQDCDSDLIVKLVNQTVNGLDYIWTFGDGSSSTQTDTTHSYHVPGTYTITLIATDTNRCHPIDSVSQQVTLLPNAVVNFTSDTVCYGKAIQFTNLSKPGIIYVWNFGDNSVSGQYSPSHMYPGPGVYQASLVIIDSSTCNIEDTITHAVTVFEQPIAGFLLNADTFAWGHLVSLQNNSQYYQTLLWNLGDGTTSDEVNPEHTYANLGAFTICLVAANPDCADSLCKSIFISFKPLIGIPNAFSPNGDGINDVVFVEGQGITEITFIIYNRWGQKVFETHDPKQGWDGTFNGVPQEMDAYTYTVEATMINGQTIPLKGNITLLR